MALPVGRAAAAVVEIGWVAVEQLGKEIMGETAVRLALMMAQAEEEAQPQLAATPVVGQVVGQATESQATFLAALFTTAAAVPVAANMASFQAGLAAAATVAL